MSERARTPGSAARKLPAKGKPVPESDPEVTERATRRRFSAQYKAGVVAEAARCQAHGELGALLRREGLYSSHLAAWRRDLEKNGVDGVGARKRGPAKRLQRSNHEVALERENRVLKKRLAKAEAIIDFQKKVHEILGIPLRHHETDGDD